MAYKELIKEISTVINGKFETISANYNFDLGDEFEIALCEFFELILPEKYGVCRGFAVTQDDKKAGDDIIIYDKERFHRLRLIEKNRFDRKVEIPIEAVYAYFEAKHKLILNGNDENFEKALKQTILFKELKREERKVLSLDHNIGFGNFFSIDGRPKWPSSANPIYTGIISRKFGTTDLRVLTQKVEKLNNLDICPDLIFAGPDIIIKTDVIEHETEHDNSPFVLKDNNPLHIFEKENSAFAIGIIQILFALDNIRLGKMPYTKILMEAVKK